ncbi:MAG: hypothetical protein KBS85_02175 [Lachnospiraceae bacterium]|nr:hypothetical protein [Candidatus Merdinaster equi]
MTKEMDSATLPLIYVNMDGELINPMHGYTVQQDMSYLRDSITPLSDSRGVSFAMERFGHTIDSINMEVRSITGKRLIENGEVTVSSTLDDMLYFDLQLKDLIDDNKEYQLKLSIIEDGSKEIFYYTRIIHASEYHSVEKIDFAKQFHDRTFDKEEVKQLARYMETGNKNDNSDFGIVDIHSSLDQLSYGELNVKEYIRPSYTITELAQQTASIKCDFVASTRVDDVIEYYRIEEYYRLRYTVDRIYLLDYRREMSKILNTDNNLYLDGGNIQLGIQANDTQIYESDSGNVLAFENAGRLFCVNVSESKISELFSFYSVKSMDERTLYNGHDIHVLSVDENGMITFTVYGYMNMGDHEGEVGIAVYQYNSLTNTTEERAFVPYKKSAVILREEMNDLTYLSKSEVYYFVLDRTIYGLHLADRRVDVLATGIVKDGFKISSDQSNIAWQVEADVNHSKSLILMNLNTQASSEIRGESGQYIKPIGFMGSDFIYGVANKEDVYTDMAGMTTFAMCLLRIQDDNGSLLKEYSEDEIFVDDAQIHGNQMILSRVKKAKDGVSYVKISDDQIISSEVEANHVNSLSSYSDELFKNQWILIIDKKDEKRSLQKLTPKFVLFEGSRKAALLEVENEDEYYVYGQKGVIGIYENPSDAVIVANDNSGVVMDDDGEYVWIKGNRSSRNQIMAIKHVQATEEKGSVAVCLDTVLGYEQIIRNSQYLLDEGENAKSILEKNMENATVLDLTGCTLDSVLYYVNRDIPVLAVVGEQAYLIIGFNENQIVLMDPTSDGLYKKNTVDMSDYFKNHGAVFLTYINKN